MSAPAEKLTVSLCPPVEQMIASLKGAQHDPRRYAELWLTQQHRIGCVVFATETASSDAIHVQSSMDHEVGRRRPYLRAFDEALKTSGYRAAVIDLLRQMGRVYPDPNGCEAQGAAA